MLNKLIKHEWKETWKIPALILGTLVLLSAACSLYFFLRPYPAADVEINLGEMSIFFVYVFLASATSMLLTIYLGIRFFKNLYTDEGYLMHTLPVAPWMLLASKALIGTLWMYLLSLFSILCVYPVTFLALPKIAPIQPGDLEKLSSYMVRMFGTSTGKLLFFLVPFMLAASIFSIVLVHTAISLAQLFGRHKVLASLLCYLGLNTLFSGVLSIFMVPAITGVVITQSAADSDQFFDLVMPQLFSRVYLVSMIAELLLAAAGFFLCKYILEKCLNLD